jgi:hypothetical protein
LLSKANNKDVVILVICLTQSQPIVFQDKDGFVYTIGDEVRRQMDDRLEVGGDDVLAPVDGDGQNCVPDRMILNANLRILLTSPPRKRDDRRWLTQDVKDEHASYVVGPWQWGRVCCHIVRDFRIIDFAYVLFIGYSYQSMTLLYADFGKLPRFVVLTLDNCSMLAQLPN